jgi:MrcB-like, N-terminal domain
VPWVRIYAPEQSPTAQEGIYLTYLFAADGSRAYLSLMHGSSEFRSDQARNPRACPRRYHEPFARPAENPTRPAISTRIVSASHVTLAMRPRRVQPYSSSRRASQNIPTKGLVGSRTVFVDTRKT